LVAEHGDPLWDAINRRMGELMPLAISVITEIFDSYDEMPFGLDLGQFTDYATTQFASRLARLERTRSQGLQEILRPTSSEG